jgi:plastocyanin
MMCGAQGDSMVSRLLTGAAVAVALAAWACGGTSSPSNPTPTPGGGGGGAAAEVISIVGSAGSQAFTPNPANDAPAGTTVAWTNNDSVTHRIVMNDGSLDTGNIAPGQTSAAMTMITNGGNYHCAIHPTMVGALKASTGAPPPCSGAYC